jgi:beta-lactam-binding protein with PASTA domain/predicted Ser/Thr protein kinase
LSTSTDELYGNRYRVVGLLGTGGMARVYRARDELLGREVALKVLSERLSNDRSFIERFRREAQNAAGLNHPNIVALYDYGDEDNRYFIVMELIEGRSLSEVLDGDGALMPERAAEIARDTANGLGRAHEAGIVHRDIKPHNIMITNSGQTKVTDFGIARALGGDAEATMTQTGMVIGTAAYLSPEQAQGNPVDARSDVYSLGCVLHEALTGDAPFSGDTPLSIAYKHVRETPERASAVNSDVPEALDAIVMKAMSKNPDNRYANANEMAEDLDRFLAGQRVDATPFLGATGVMDPSGTQVLSETQVYDDYPEEETKSKTGKYILITVLVLGLLALGAFLLANFLGGPTEVEIPDVVGLSEDRATNELEDAGLEVRARDRSNPEVDEGDVIRQDPEAGATAEEGDTVTIFVSSGPGEVSVPNLLSLTEDQAEDALDEVGLELGKVRRVSSESAEGTVIEQNPESGELVNEGDSVNIVVSTGVVTATVPDVVGLPEADAVAAIEGEGLTADVVTEPSDEADEGIVIAQDPGAGTELEEGSAVQILVSEGPEFEMPVVQGDDADEAEAFLEDELGLDVSQEGSPEPCPQPPGTVCTQDPEPGEPVQPGDSVTLFVQEVDP